MHWKLEEQVSLEHSTMTLCENTILIDQLHYQEKSSEELNE